MAAHLVVGRLANVVNARDQFVREVLQQAYLASQVALFLIAIHPMYAVQKN